MWVIKSKRMRWAGRVARMGGERILLRKPEGKRSLGISRRRWKGNIELYIEEDVCGGVD